MNLSPDSLPAWPVCKAHGAPVFLEPMMGSGERIAVAVAVCDGQGGFEVQPSIRRDTLDNMYGAKGENLYGFVKLTCESLGRHLSEGKPMCGWNPPFNGAYLGNVRDMVCDDLDHALRQLLTLHSSLASLSEADDDEQDQPAPSTRLGDQWRDSVKGLAVAQRPGIAKAFNIKTKLFQGGMPARFGFLNSRFAAQFEVLHPDKAFASLSRVRSNLWLLQQAAASQTENTGLYLLTVEASNLLYSPAQHNRAMQTLEEIRLESQAKGIALIDCLSPFAAASHLLENAA